MKTQKIKLAVVSMLIACVIGICGCSLGGAKYDFNIDTDHDFRGIDLGASSATVKATETNTISSETALGEQTILQYKDVSVDGLNASIMYTIDASGKFASGSVYYSCEEKELDAAYNALADKCKELYGTTYLFSDAESIHWKVGDKMVCVLKTKSKVIYNVCTEENYYGNN